MRRPATLFACDTALLLAALLSASCRGASAICQDCVHVQSPAGVEPKSISADTDGDLGADSWLLRRVRECRIDGLPIESREPLAVVSLLRTATGLNIFVSPQAQVELTESSKTLPWGRFEAGSVADVLDRLSVECGLRWEAGGGLITLRVASESRWPLRFYDVNDLVWPVEPFEGTPPGPSIEVGAGRTEVPIHRGVLLTAAIRAAVEPAVWKHSDATLEARSGVLIVRAPATTHTSITEFLAAVRREAPAGAAR